MSSGGRSGAAPTAAPRGSRCGVGARAMRRKPPSWPTGPPGRVGNGAAKCAVRGRARQAGYAPPPAVFPLKDSIGTERTPVMTIALILANVVVFLLSIRHGGSIWSGPDNQTVVQYGAIPYEFSHYGKECDLVSTGQVLCQGQPTVTGVPSSQP